MKFSDKLENEYSGYGYGDKSYNFIPFVKERDTQPSGIREDIGDHVDMWKDYQSKFYNQTDIEGMLELLNNYTSAEIDKLKLNEPIYISPMRKVTKR